MLFFTASFLAGVVFTTIAVWMLFKGRLLVAAINGTAGLSILSITLFFALLLLNAYTYSQLTSEQELAEIHIGARTDDGIPVRIQTDTRQQVFYINAEEWQLDARFLKWKPWAYLLGSVPLVRLESLTERRPYSNENARVQYDLVSQHSILTELGSSLSDWIGIVDTYYGSAVYMPAVEGSSYSVSATISGLVARAENKQAHNAVSEWMSQ